MGKMQLLDGADRVIPGKIIATVELGIFPAEELLKIFDERKIGAVDKILERIETSPEKIVVNVWAVSIAQLIEGRKERRHIKDVYKQAKKLNLVCCSAEALIMVSSMLGCNGNNTTMLCAMEPTFASWGTCGILKIYAEDGVYKIGPEFFHPYFEFDPDTVWIFMEIIK